MRVIYASCAFLLFAYAFKGDVHITGENMLTETDYRAIYSARFTMVMQFATVVRFALTEKKLLINKILYVILCVFGFISIFYSFKLVVCLSPPLFSVSLLD